MLFYSMKPKPLFEPHLVLKEIKLSTGEEFIAQSPGWHFLQVISGLCYWVSTRMNLELTIGSVLVFSDRARGIVRASQLDEALLHSFRLQPDRLTGLLTSSEARFLDRNAAHAQFVARSFPNATPIAQKFKALSEQGNALSLRGRLQMVELFDEVVGGELQKYEPGPEPPADAKARLVKLLKEIPPTELLELRFGDLVRETRCTPRHLGRVFKQVVGMSFREKQSEARLLRAQELLMTTESKVVEIALESGYQSPCLFNLLFKRRFGVTPAKWRDLSKKRGFSSRPAAPSLILKTKGEPLALASL